MPPHSPRLPEHPKLREIALVIEKAGMIGEVLDAKFRCFFISSETVSSTGMSADEAHSLLGLSTVVRSSDQRTAGIVRVTAESGSAWFEHNAPIMRKYMEPDDPEFQEVFGTSAKFAEQMELIEAAPRAWHDIVSFPPNLRFRRTFLGDQNQVQMRIGAGDSRRTCSSASSQTTRRSPTSTPTRSPTRCWVNSTESARRRSATPGRFRLRRSEPTQKPG